MELKSANDLEAALADSETRFRCLVEYASDGYLLLDEGGRVLDVNASACDAHGRPRSELLSLHVSVLFEGEAVASLTKIDETLCAGRPRTVELTARRGDGSSFPAEVRVGLVESPAGRMFMALVRDVSERERSQERIEYLTGHDSLTELPNARLFASQVEEALAHAGVAGRQVAVLHLDLNRFSLVNQGLGPAGGDELLRQVGARLRAAVRPMDVVARYSADEFLVLAADLWPELRPGWAPTGESTVPDQASGVGPTDEPAGAQQAHAVAAAIHEALADPFEIGGREVYVDAAIGISLFPLDADGVETLLRHADQAAQQAKRPGEGPTTQFAEDTSDKWGRLWLATRLRKAVEREELALHFQPIIDLGSLPRGARRVSDRLGPHVFALEALVRWRDKQGLVPPAGFVPLAEDLGLIGDIGRWVVREGSRQAVGWRDAGRGASIAFNLSLHELWQSDLVQRIEGQVADAGLEPDAVILEITESSAMTDPVRTARTLYELRRRGFRLAIDDFGAGHSSFARLADLPFELLKIDRSFVARLPEDPSAAAMVTAMLELAERLGMRAVAEGIESEEQLECLLSHGCSLGQGFLFSRPVPPEEVLEL